MVPLLRVTAGTLQIIESATFSILISVWILCNPALLSATIIFVGSVIVSFIAVEVSFLIEIFTSPVYASALSTEMSIVERSTVIFFFFLASSFASMAVMVSVFPVLYLASLTVRLSTLTFFHSNGKISASIVASPTETVVSPFWIISRFSASSVSGNETLSFVAVISNSSGVFIIFRAFLIIKS